MQSWCVIMLWLWFGLGYMKHFMHFYSNWDHWLSLPLHFLCKIIYRGVFLFVFNQEKEVISNCYNIRDNKDKPVPQTHHNINCPRMWWCSGWCHWLTATGLQVWSWAVLLFTCSHFICMGLHFPLTVQKKHIHCLV